MYGPLTVTTCFHFERANSALARVTTSGRIGLDKEMLLRYFQSQYINRIRSRDDILANMKVHLSDAVDLTVLNENEEHALLQ